VKSSKPKASEHEVQALVAEKIISRYAKMSATNGGVTALAGVIPGLGTAVAMVGGGLTDATIGMKFQVDMCRCLADTFGWDLASDQACAITVATVVHRVDHALLERCRR
jgi:hypothetical protein